MTKKYIIPFDKRRTFHVVFAVIATVLFVAACGLAWWLALAGGWNAMSTLFVIGTTLGSICSLIALITGHMGWLLIGLMDVVV